MVLWKDTYATSVVKCIGRKKTPTGAVKREEMNKYKFWCRNCEKGFSVDSEGLSSRYCSTKCKKDHDALTTKMPFNMKECPFGAGLVSVISYGGRVETTYDAGGGFIYERTTH